MFFSSIKEINKLLSKVTSSIYLKVHTDADLKICKHLRFFMKIICWRFHIKTSFAFRDMRTYAASFVEHQEHLQKLKEPIIKIQKKKIKWFFHICLLLIKQY